VVLLKSEKSKTPLPNESEPSSDLHFKDANDYSSYMKRNGIWGSYLEAEVIAKILGIPLVLFGTNIVGVAMTS
jgi:hypothetical protein